ncbi:Vacuolar protein sorting-associated protein 26 [Ciborinia camelliae]|nr:Vacuolar protein sorting-associated protein 26 [Ciborinia camelliae]
MANNQNPQMTGARTNKPPITDPYMPLAIQYLLLRASTPSPSPAQLSRFAHYCQISEDELKGPAITYTSDPAHKIHPSKLKLYLSEVDSKLEAYALRIEAHEHKLRVDELIASELHDRYLERTAGKIRGYKVFVDELAIKQAKQKSQEGFRAALEEVRSHRDRKAPVTTTPEVQEIQSPEQADLDKKKLINTVELGSELRGNSLQRSVRIDMSFLFSAPVDIDIVLEDGDSRETVEVKNKSSKERVPLYKDGESVRGAVTIRPKDGKRLEHTGIKVQFIGMIEMFYDRGNHYEFLSLGQELAAPGDLQHPQAYDFNFKNVEKQYESYNGINVKLRYFIKVTVSRRMADVIREKDLWVFSYRIPPEMNSSIKMDVGIEDCLHIEFEYSKSKYHLKDVIVGRIYFLLVRLKIKHMELSIIRRETTGTPPNQYNESETLVRFEIMDGSPSRGETIPIRLFLGGFDLTPTFREVNKKYSTRYYLSLVLIDEDARRYFKQSEIVLYRQQPEDVLALGQQTKIAGAHSAPNPAAQKRISAQ